MEWHSRENAPKRQDLQGRQGHLVRHAARCELMMSWSCPSGAGWMLVSKTALGLMGWTVAEIRVSDCLSWLQGWMETSVQTMYLRLYCNLEHTRVYPHRDREARHVRGAV